MKKLSDNAVAAIGIIFMSLVYLAAIIVIGLTSGCGTAERDSTPPVMIKKVVASKKEAQETSYRYVYNAWKGTFYHQPDIHTAYYLVFTDGTFQEVSVGKFGITDVGDTLSLPQNTIFLE